MDRWLCRLANKRFCRIADNSLVRCNLVGNHGASTNDCSLSDFNPGQYHGTGANEGMLVNMYFASEVCTWTNMHSVFEYALMID